MNNLAEGWCRRRRDGC